jgi:hypothetical protein
MAEDPAGPPRSRSPGAGRFQKKFRGLIAEARAAHPEARRLEVWFQDEARIGQTGRNCRKWFQRGVRPTGVKDQRHTAVYLFGAACPERDAAFGLVLPIVSSGAMQAFLDQFSEQIAPNTHALLLMDRAGWHCANDLVFPENLTPIFLPPYSPELNAIERLWLYIKESFLSHRLWDDYDAIVDAVCRAWQRVTGEAERIKSLCSTEWTRKVEN